MNEKKIDLIKHQNNKETKIGNILTSTTDSSRQTIDSHQTATMSSATMSSAQEEHCTVCVGNINKKNIQITCPVCEFSSCHLCNELFFKTSVCSPKCMNCGIPWSRETLNTQFRKASIKRILDNRKDVLLHEQEAKLAITQEYVKLQNTNIELKSEIDLLYVQINEKYNMIQVNRNRLHRMESGTDNNNDSGTIVEYIRICGKNDCKGYINKSNHTCEMCKNKVCKTCLMDNVDEEHICNPDDIETARLLKNNTKPCPKCYVPIFKINGCSHMFCTSCNTAFDWKTLSIHQNGNSNPHYFDWIRRTTGTTAVPVPECGDDYNVYHLSTYPVFKKLYEDQRWVILRMFEYMSHQEAILPRQPVYERDLLRLRADYMQNNIDLVTFRNKISKIHLEYEYKTGIRLVLQTVIDTKQDFINRMMYAKDIQGILEVAKEINAFVENTNVSLDKCGEVYNRTVNPYKYKP